MFDSFSNHQIAKVQIVYLLLSQKTADHFVYDAKTVSDFDISVIFYRQYKNMTIYRVNYRL